MDRDVSCGTFRRQLYHFQADELSEAERRLCSEHLERCADCVRLLEIENGFSSALRQRLRGEPAPAELVRRVRDALDDEARSAWRGRWAWTPWVATAAASILIGLLLIPGLSGRPLTAALGGVVHVEQQALLVDLECDRVGYTLNEQRGCLDPHHLNALKLGPDLYWNLSLEDGPGRELVVDLELRGHRLRVEGEFYAGIRTLQLTGFEDLGLESPPLSASLGVRLACAEP